MTDPDNGQGPLETAPDTPAGPAAPGRRLVGVWVGRELYGLPLERLREVTRVTRIRRVPGAAPKVAGLVNVRGEILCALDLKVMLGVPQDPAHGALHVAVVRGAAEPLGLVVDAIAEVYAIADDAIVPHASTLGPEQAPLLAGTTRVPEGLMGVLDLDRIIGP